MTRLDPMPDSAPAAIATPPATGEATRLSEISTQQWRSGIAAWLGWMFDGLDMHLYTLVAMPFVAELMGLLPTDHLVKARGSWIQAAFLTGWALGGGFFGRIGDRLGRVRALNLTILTYALFTGLSFFAHTWWQLFIFRFLAALGIGGEWAVGASLLSETWPSKWRPWIAAVLQTGVNLGVLFGSCAYFALSHFGHLVNVNRTVFLIGILPAFLVLWIRRAVPESEEWTAAKNREGYVHPRIVDLFQPAIRRTTILTILVCGLSLSPHWTYMYWYVQHMRNLMRIESVPETVINLAAGKAFMLMMAGSMVGNFLCAGLAKRWGYRRVIVLVCLTYFALIVTGYGVRRPHQALWTFVGLIGICQGLYALFTMYLPPLFPTLLRTTGAGFCYNIGRLIAAVGVVFFGRFTSVDDYRLVMFYASFLFLPAAFVAVFMPELKDGRAIPSTASAFTPAE